MGRGWGGCGWGAEGGVKRCAFSKCHELIQSTREAQTAVWSSLVPHAVLLTHPRTMKCTLVVSQHRQKAICKSRPGNLLSSAWRFWIVHECAYHVQAKDGFQFLCLYGRFSKIRSHITTLFVQDIWRDYIVPQEKYSALNISNFSKYKMRRDGQFSQRWSHIIKLYYNSKNLNCGLQ